MMIAAPVEEVVTSHVLTAQRVEKPLKWPLCKLSEKGRSIQQIFMKK